MGEGGHGNDVQPQFGSLALKGLIDTGGIGVSVVVDDGDLLADLLVEDVFSGRGALCRVREADLIRIVLVRDDLQRGGGGREHEHALVIRLRGDSNAGGCRHAAKDDLRALVQRRVVSVDGLFSVVFIVLHIQHNVHLAGGVDFFHGDFRAARNCQTIDGGSAGHRANHADVNRRRFLRGREGRHTQRHGQSKNETKELLHENQPPYQVDGRKRVPFVMQQLYASDGVP